MYIEVKFHDNDFGYSLMVTMEDIWKKYRTMIIYGKKFESKSIENIFKKLNKEDVLIPIIRGLWVLAQLEEGINRIIAHSCFDIYSEIEAIKKPIDDKYTEYLNPEIEFHEDDAFMNKDQNGEHVGLDLSTGIAIIF